MGLITYESINGRFLSLARSKFYLKPGDAPIKWQNFNKFIPAQLSTEVPSLAFINVCPIFSAGIELFSCFYHYPG